MRDLPDNLPLLLVVAWVLGPGIWLAIVACRFGHLKVIHLKRLSQCAMVCVLLAGAGHSQQSGWAQDQLRALDAANREQDARINRLTSDVEVHKNVEEITRNQINRDITKIDERTEASEKDIQNLKSAEQRLYGIALALGALGSAFVYGLMEIVKAYRSKNGRNGNGTH